MSNIPENNTQMFIRYNNSGSSDRPWELLSYDNNTKVETRHSDNMSSTNVKSYTLPEHYYRVSFIPTEIAEKLLVGGQVKLLDKKDLNKIYGQISFLLKKDTKTIFLYYLHDTNEPIDNISPVVAKALIKTGLARYVLDIP